MEVDEPLQSPATPATDGSNNGGPMKFKLKFVAPPNQDVNMSEAGLVQEIPAASTSAQQQVQPIASGSTEIQSAAVAPIVAPPPVPEVPVKKKRAPPKKKADKPPKAEKQPAVGPDGEVKPHWRRGLKGKAADAAQFYNAEVKPDTPPTRSRPRKSKAATGEAGTPEPGAIPGTSSFSVAAPKAVTGPLTVLPLAAKTPATRKWQKAPFSFVNIAGSKMALPTWTGSEESPFAEYQKKNEPAKVDGEGDSTPKATKEAKPKKASTATPLPAKTAAMPLMPDQAAGLPPMADQGAPLPSMPDQHALPPMPDQAFPPSAPALPHSSLPPPATFSPQHYVQSEHPHQAYPAQHFSPMHAYSSPQHQRSPYAPHPSSNLAHHATPSSSHLGSASPMSLTNLMSPSKTAPAGPYFSQPSQPAHLSPHQTQGHFQPQVMQRSSSHGSGSQG